MLPVCGCSAAWIEISYSTYMRMTGNADRTKQKKRTEVRGRSQINAGGEKGEPDLFL